MSTIYCNSCGTENLDSMKFCKQCGSKLTASESGDSTVQTFSGARTAVSASPVRIEVKYKALRTIASLCRFLSYLFVGLAVLGAIGGFILLSDSVLTRLGALLGAFVWGAITYIFWQIIAESISVLLDIEVNTRQAAAALEQQWG
jgi:hypothetical protein